MKAVGRTVCLHELKHSCNFPFTCTTPLIPGGVFEANRWVIFPCDCIPTPSTAAFFFWIVFMMTLNTLPKKAYFTLYQDSASSPVLVLYNLYGFWVGLYFCKFLIHIKQNKTEILIVTGIFILTYLVIRKRTRTMQISNLTTSMLAITMPFQLWEKVSTRPIKPYFSKEDLWVSSLIVGL